MRHENKVHAKALARPPFFSQAYLTELTDPHGHAFGPNQAPVDPQNHIQDQPKHPKTQIWLDLASVTVHFLASKINPNCPISLKPCIRLGVVATLVAVFHITPTKIFKHVIAQRTHSLVWGMDHRSKWDLAPCGVCR